jgi:hypothetical protein
MIMQEEETTTVADELTREEIQARIDELAAWRAQFESDAWDMGDRQNLCSSYDNYLSQLDMRQRPRQQSVTVVRAVERGETRPPVIAQYANINVRAHTLEEAHTIAEQRLASGELTGLNWQRLHGAHDAQYYLPELTAEQLATDEPADTTVVIAPRVWTGPYNTSGRY